MLELSIEAAYSRDKRHAPQRANTRLEVAKHLWRFAAGDFGQTSGAARGSPNVPLASMFTPWCVDCGGRPRLPKPHTQAIRVQ